MEDKVQLYTVMDRCAGRYGPIFEAVNDAVAVRQFRGSMAAIPEYTRDDYSLIRLGSYDHISGVVVIDDVSAEIEGGGYFRQATLIRNKEDEK